jgi:hypothetical protein
MLGGDWSSVSLAARYHIQAIRALPDGATQAPARPDTNSRTCKNLTANEKIQAAATKD